MALGFRAQFLMEEQESEGTATFNPQRRGRRKYAGDQLTSALHSLQDPSPQYAATHTQDLFPYLSSSNLEILTHTHISMVILNLSGRQS